MERVVLAISLLRRQQRESARWRRGRETCINASLVDFLCSATRRGIYSARGHGSATEIVEAIRATRTSRSRALSGGRTLAIARRASSALQRTTSRRTSSALGMRSRFALGSLPVRGGQSRGMTRGRAGNLRGAIWIRRGRRAGRKTPRRKSPQARSRTEQLYSLGRRAGSE